MVLPEVGCCHPATASCPVPVYLRLVSTIISCYSRAHVVRETIDSVLAQTHAKFEAIIIDDGSAETIRGVITGYTDRRMRCFYKSNGGLSSARKAGLDVARDGSLANRGVIGMTNIR